MSKSMVSKYISKKWDEISKDTTEYKAYNLGLAVAYHHFYDFYKNHLGKKDADDFMKNFIGSGGVKELYRIILNKAVMNIFGDSYAYTRAYKKFCEEMKAKEKQQ